MRIGIDARFFGSGGGIPRYTKELVHNLEQIDHTNEYVIFLRKNNWEEYTPSQPNFTKQMADAHWYTLREQWVLPRSIRKARVDCMHFPHWNVPVLHTKPFVVTIHDLILLHYPSKKASTLHPLWYRIKQFGYRIVLQHALQQSRHILATSEYTKQDIISTFHIQPKKITATYQAPASSVSAQREVEGVLPPLGIRHPYLLYVGNSYPHKNLEGLLSIFKKVQEKISNPLQLVLVGTEDYFYLRLKQSPEARALGNSLVCTGYLSDEDLVSVYRHALTYVFPSLYEGFGIPPLEAMAHGLPIVASNRTCLPEILQDAALLHDPKDEEGFARIICSVIEDPKLQQMLRERGTRHAKRFSWITLARQTRKIYEDSVY